MSIAWPFDFNMDFNITKSLKLRLGRGAFMLRFEIRHAVSAFDCERLGFYQPTNDDQKNPALHLALKNGAAIDDER